MRAGDLDRRLTIERASENFDPLDQRTQAFVPLATVWAQKIEASERERIAAREVGAEIVTRFRVRHSKDVASVDARDRCVCDGRTYEITGRKEIGYREGLEISAVARTDVSS